MANENQRRTDGEIARRMSPVYDLRFQRNTFTPISSLPIEILAGIFVHCALHYQAVTFWHLPRVPNWVNVSYVCRHWRTVALDCPTLWSYLFMVSRRWTEELLSRSKQTELKIAVGMNYNQEELFTFFLKRVADHTQHIRELTLNLRGWRGIRRAFGPLIRPSSCAPRLRVLRIQGHGFFSLANNIFSGETPSLRELKLQNIGVPWYSFQLSDLTSLSLTDILPPYQANIAEFRSTLGRMHNLVHLHLRRALPNTRDFLASVDHDDSQRISLPRLSRLSIVEPLATVVAVVSCTDVPSSTEMRLHCDCENDASPDDYSSLYSFLERGLCSTGDQSSSPSTIRTLDFSFFAALFTFSASEHDRGRIVREDNDIWGCKISLSLKVDFGETFSKVNRIVSDICQRVPPKDVEDVHVHSLKWSTTFWKDALERFQGLRRLRVACSKTPDLFSALSLLSPNDTESQDGYMGQGSHLLCAPSLEALALSTIRQLTSNDSIDIRSLRKAVSIRNEQGRALKQLIVNSSDGVRLEDVWDMPVVAKICFGCKSYPKASSQ